VLLHYFVKCQSVLKATIENKTTSVTTHCWATLRAVDSLYRWTVAARRARMTTATAPGSTAVDRSRRCLCRRPAASAEFRRRTTKIDAATRCFVRQSRAIRTVVSWTPSSFQTTTSRVDRFGLRFPTPRIQYD